MKKYSLLQRYFLKDFIGNKGLLSEHMFWVFQKTMSLDFLEEIRSF